MSITFWYRVSLHVSKPAKWFNRCVLVSLQSGPVPNKITYPFNSQQKTAITRNMLNEALQDPAEVCMCVCVCVCVCGRDPVMQVIPLCTVGNMVERSGGRGI